MTTGREALLAALRERPDEAIADLIAQGIPGPVAEASLADIPRKVELYGDLVDDDWLQQVLHGQVLALGRLQYERDPGPRGRHLHIPETGPLDPAAVDASLTLAADYFTDDAPLICESWLFDPALSRLSPRSNLRTFADRFDRESAPKTEEGANSLATFVFRSTPQEVVREGLSANASALQRIAYAALAGDGLWSEPVALLRH